MFPGCEHKTFKDVVLGFEKCATTIFWSFVNQQLIVHEREQSTD